jgi:hypothetical protein
MPDTKSINLKVNDGPFLEQLMSKQSAISIDGQELKPEQVNTSTHPNFISIMVSGLSTDDLGRPDYGEVKDMAGSFANQIQTIQTKGSKTGGPAAAHVTDIYAEYSKFIFDDAPRFMGVLRAATRLFPSMAVANTLPGYFRFNDVCTQMQYRGRLDHCPKCGDRNGGLPHTTDACPTRSSDSCYSCGATGHIKNNCPKNPKPDPKAGNSPKADNKNPSGPPATGPSLQDYIRANHGITIPDPPISIETRSASATSTHKRTADKLAREAAKHQRNA